MGDSGESVKQWLTKALAAAQNIVLAVKEAVS
jgi:hypothetical protein